MISCLARHFKEGDILDLAVKENIIEKSGALPGLPTAVRQIGQAVRTPAVPGDNPAMMAEVEAKVRARYAELPEPKKPWRRLRMQLPRPEDRRTGGAKTKMSRAKYDGHIHHPVDKKRAKSSLRKALPLFYTEVSGTGLL